MSSALNTWLKVTLDYFWRRWDISQLRPSWYLSFVDLTLTETPRFLSKSSARPYNLCSLAIPMIRILLLLSLISRDSVLIKIAQLKLITSEKMNNLLKITISLVTNTIQRKNAVYYSWIEWEMSLTNPTRLSNRILERAIMRERIEEMTIIIRLTLLRSEFLTHHLPTRTVALSLIKAKINQWHSTIT
jgi:hypothetical protein